MGMKNICIYVPEQSVMQAIADPQYLFSALNHFLEQAGKAKLFRIMLVGLKRNISLNEGLYTVNCTHTISEVQQADLIILPALFGDMHAALEANAAAIPWIKQLYQNGAELASLCLGAFLLGATGLVNGKSCSTHWGRQDEFQAFFPEVAVADGRIVTEDGRLYSSGGALSYWNLLLHLAEKYTNRELAILAAKYFAVDIDRESQSAFAMFNGQRKHADSAVLEAQDLIEAALPEKITIDELAEKVALGRRTFERRFKAATNNSVLEYINRVKMERAKRSFENEQKNINEVMYTVGYSDTKAFRNIFKKYVGLTPLAYRSKYNKKEVPHADY